MSIFLTRPTMTLNGMKNLSSNEEFVFEYAMKNLSIGNMRNYIRLQVMCVGTWGTGRRRRPHFRYLLKWHAARLKPTTPHRYMQPPLKAPEVTSK